MNLRRIKHTLLRLSPEEKMMGIGSVVVLFSYLMPWYEVTNKVSETNITHNGFSGDLGVIGFVTFLLTGMAISTMLAEYMHLKIPTFGYAKEKVVLFLSGQSAFLLLLMLGVYTKRSLDFTSAGIRFGLYTAIIGSFLSTFAIYAQSQKKEKRATNELFGLQEEEVINEVQAEEMAAEEVVEPTQSTEGFFYDQQVEEQAVVAEAATEETVEMEDDIAEAYQETEVAEVEEERTVGDVIQLEEMTEDETLEETELAESTEPVEAVESAASVEEVTDEPAEMNTQGDYFKREAGVKKSDITVEDIKPVEEVAEEKSEKKQAVTDDFYEDL